MISSPGLGKYHLESEIPIPEDEAARDPYFMTLFRALTFFSSTRKMHSFSREVSYRRFKPQPEITSALLSKAEVHRDLRQLWLICLPNSSYFFAQ